VIPNAMCHRQSPIALCYILTRLLEAVCEHIAVSDVVWSHVMCCPLQLGLAGGRSNLPKCEQLWCQLKLIVTVADSAGL
jgi:hypothetical protein